nr:unnamed protein product [Callosobruchus analis]
MDDIVQARKVRMKMWNTSREKVCEVQPLDDTGTVQRYTNSVARRFSDFVGTTLAPIPSVKKPSSGIVCTNTDLISILHSLSTSATEINQCEKEQDDRDNASTSRKRGQLKNSRSNSFDISILQEKLSSMETISIPTPSNWFTKRHQPTKTDIIKKPVSIEKYTIYISNILCKHKDRWNKQRISKQIIRFLLTTTPREFSQHYENCESEWESVNCKAKMKMCKF